MIGTRSVLREGEELVEKENPVVGGLEEDLFGGERISYVNWRDPNELDLFLSFGEYRLISCIPRKTG